MDANQKTVTSEDFSSSTTVKILNIGTYMSEQTV